MITAHRTVLRRRILQSNARRLHVYTPLREKAEDPRIRHLGTVIEDEFAILREDYETPKNPIILAHGLLGFEEIHLTPLVGIKYFAGITDALAAKGVEVITTAVPPSGRIEARAQKLAETISRRAGGKSVNIVAGMVADMNICLVVITDWYSGLDARYMISQLKPPNLKVLSLTTIATPHHGSAFADFLFTQIGAKNIPKLYKVLEFFGLETGAFRQLTAQYMNEKFNPRTPDLEGVKYYSYGAQFRPQLTSVFRVSHDVIEKEEGANDGLVSVASSQWGTYKGTLDQVSHLDLINWTNRIRWWWIWRVTGKKRTFNAVAFYLAIADMLAKEGF